MKYYSQQALLDVQGHVQMYMSSKEVIMGRVGLYVNRWHGITIVMANLCRIESVNRAYTDGNQAKLFMFYMHVCAGTRQNHHHMVEPISLLRPLLSI